MFVKNEHWWCLLKREHLWCSLKREHWWCLLYNLLPFQLPIDCLFAHTNNCSLLSVYHICLPTNQEEREKNTKYRQMQNTKYGNEQNTRKCKVQNTGRCISCVCWPITKIGTSAKNQSWHRREWFGFAKIDSSAILEQIKQTTILHQVKFVWMKSTHMSIYKYKKWVLPKSIFWV